MTISFSGNTITVGSYTLTATPTGFVSDGVLMNKRGSTLTGGFNASSNTSPVLGTYAGYYYGGRQVTPPSDLNKLSSTITLFKFSNDTVLSSPPDLNTAVNALNAPARYGGGKRAGVNSQNFGYAIDESFNGFVEKFPFANGVRTIGFPININSVFTTIGYGASAPSPSPLSVDVDKAEGATGHSSVTDGYTTGGVNQTSPPQSQSEDQIGKFPFANESIIFIAGDVASPRAYLAGCSSFNNGYSIGGIEENAAPTGPPSPAPVARDSIQKFPFSSDTDTTITASLVTTRFDCYGMSSENNGYVVGGLTSVADISDVKYGSTPNYPTRPPVPSLASITTTIEKFPFATDVNSVVIGNANASPRSVGEMRGAVQSHSDGYFSTFGGNHSKMPFASDVDSTVISPNLGPTGNVVRQGACIQD